jgi:hypothetical protein
MNSNDNNMNEVSATKFVAVSAWMQAAEAKALRDQLIAQHGKGKVKLSSYRWVDPKDHNKGYLARVVAIEGLMPKAEAEVVAKKAAKTKKTKSVTACVSGNSNTEAMALTYWVRRNSISDTTTA